MRSAVRTAVSTRMHGISPFDGLHNTPPCSPPARLASSASPTAPNPANLTAGSRNMTARRVLGSSLDCLSVDSQQLVRSASPASCRRHSRRPTCPSAKAEPSKKVVIKDILSRLCHLPFSRHAFSSRAGCSSVRPERHSQATKPYPGCQDALGCVGPRLIGWQALNRVRRPALPRLNGYELQTAGHGPLPIIRTCRPSTNPTVAFRPSINPITHVPYPYCFPRPLAGRTSGTGP